MNSLAVKSRMDAAETPSLRANLSFMPSPSATRAQQMLLEDFRVFATLAHEFAFAWANDNNLKI